MGAMLRNWVRRIGTTFAAFTPGQKLVVVLAVVALGVSGVVFSGVVNKPTYAPLFTGLSAADASKIVDDLGAAGTEYELSDGGSTILVPRDKVYGERIRLSGAGLPAGDTGGYPLLDKQGITASEFQQQIGFQRAMEGELAKTLQAMEGVDTALVHLAIPKRDVFATEDGKPSASVLLKTRAGRELSGEQIQSVVHMVSSSIENLDPDKVTVTDAAGRMLSTSKEHGGAGATDLRSRQTRDYEERMSTNIRAALERVVGPGNAVVQVTADLDFDTTKLRSRRFTDPNVKPLAESGTTEKYAGAGAGGIPPVGVLGPDNQSNFDRDNDNGDDNVDGDAAAGNDDAGNDYEKIQSSKNNAVNEEVEERNAAAGSVRKLGIGVLLNAKVAGALDTAEIEALVSSAAGVNLERGDQVKISNLPFDTTAAEKAAADLAAQEAAEKQDELMSIAKTASLIFAIFILLLMAIIGGRKRSKAAAALRRAEMEAVKKRMEQLEIERLRALEGSGRAVAELEAPNPVGQHMTQVREELTELVESQPDEVAQLLRTWLADRRA